MLAFYKKRKEFIVLSLILALGLFLRIYKLPQMVGFDFDQEYCAMFAQQVLQVYPIQMIGQGLSVQGLFMGPFYFYYLVPFFAITNLHPIGGYVGSIILGLIITVAYFFLFKNIFGTKAALVAAFLRATLLTRLQYDWTMAPSYSSELSVLVAWFGLYKYWKGNNNYLLLLAFTFGLFTSFHPIQFPFYLVFLLIFLIKRRIPSLKIFILSIALFILPIIPLILFEYYRNFTEVTTLFSIKQSAKSEVKTFSTLLEYLLIVFNYPSTIFNIQAPQFVKNIISLLFYGTGLFVAVKQIGFWKEKFHLTFLALTTVTFLIYYFVLPTHVPEYYFLGLEIVIFIYICASFSLLKNKFKHILSLILIFIFALNLITLYQRWQHQNWVSLADKDYIFQQIKEREKNNTDYSVYYTTTPGQKYGLGYLARYYKVEGLGNSTTYEIVIPSYLTKEKGAIISPSGNATVLIRKK